MAEFACAPLILIGPGSLGGLSRKLVREGIQRSLIITDHGLVMANVVDRVIQALNEDRIECELFDGVTPNPTIDQVEEAKLKYTTTNCDGIIAVGGGSAIDCAKAVCARLSGMGMLDDPAAPKEMPKHAPLFVAISTTAGTGSEVSRAYLITDSRTHRKLIFKDDYALPQIAVNDCELMMGLPASITAWTGMDALTHAIEAYVSTRGFLITDMLSLDAIRIIAQHLPNVVHDGASILSRNAMACAEFLAGVSFGSAGLGLVHAMAHQLGALYDVPHGLANAVLLPEILEYYIDVSTKRLADIAAAINPMFASIPEREAANEAIDAIRKMLIDLDIDASPIRFLYRESDLDTLAAQTVTDGCIITSPKVPDLETIKKLFSRAIGSAPVSVH